MKYLLKNGTVISGTGGKKLDVLVDGEKIIRVGESLFEQDAKVVDCGCGGGANIKRLLKK